ncbi:MAG: hypothetical protein ACPG6V_02810 [Flavobacteriales bacterium]
MKTLLTGFISLAFIQIGFSQISDYERTTFNEAYLLGQNESKLYSDTNAEYIHTSIKPYRPATLIKYISPAEVEYSYKDLPDRSWLARKLFHQDLIRYHSEEEQFDIRINPLMNFGMIRDENLGVFNGVSLHPSAVVDPTNKTGFVNTRGIQILGQLGERFSFYTELYENQVDLPGYVKDWSVQNNLVVPGAGIVDFLTNDQYDYLLASGYIQYRSKKYFTFEFGTGKNFIGDGYRSLLLSDNAPISPYLKITTEFGKVKYMNLYTKYLDVNPSVNDDNHYSKWAASHYLTFNLGKRLSLGVFESTMWGDRENQRGYDITYLNPIIFYRSLEFLNGSEGVNVLLGGNAQYKLSDSYALYGQFILDEFKINEFFAGNGYWGNKYGFQLGVKGFNVLKVKNLNITSEINYVRPFTYSHETSNSPNLGGLSNYGHLNQSLAHPLGANFFEWISTGSYQYNRWVVNGELMIATKGFDNPGENFGGDIYQSNLYGNRPLGDYGYDNISGNKANIFLLSGRVGYIVNPMYNLKFEAGITIREFSPEVETSTLQKRSDVIFTFGLKTDLFKNSNKF